MNLVGKKLVRFVSYTQQILKMKNPRHLKTLKRTPHVGINKKPKNQHNFQRVKHHAVNDRNVHHEESRLRNRKKIKRIIIFSDSSPKGIRIRELIAILPTNCQTKKFSWSFLKTANTLRGTNITRRIV